MSAASCTGDSIGRDRVVLEDEDNELEETGDHDWTEEFDPTIKPYVSEEWREYLRSFRGREPTEAQLWWGRHIIRDLFYALHSRALSSLTNKEEQPRGYWYHQQFDPFRTNDATRGFDIERGTLLEVASGYLSNPEGRTNRLDWIFLDAIVFEELDAYANKVITTRAGTGFNWATIFSPRNQLQYFGLSVLFWVLGILFSYVAPLALAYYLYTSAHPIGAAVTAGIWALLLAWRVITYPLRWQARRKARKLVKHLIDLYTILGDSTISPTHWKKMLETAAAEGVVLDGAVFTIIDRAIDRDPTAFLPHQAG
jgi:hypothetical protein